ncbi:MAG: hypothetical protein IT165_07070 [Bryobacterales bacterium]|nr:hypothetical protein [Bryobacterales bacterium]
MQHLLEQLTQRVTKTFGERLVSLILYGSGASEEYNGAFSDLNILCVLSRVTLAELRDSEPIFHWWRKHENPAPLLLSHEELRASTDCFPIEFHDMKERRKVLAGIDVIESLEIDNSFYRAQVEYQLRAKLLRLRQKAAGVMEDRELLSRLLVESLPTFTLLFRHALRLGGFPAPSQRIAVIDEVERRFAVEPQPLLGVLALRQKKIRPRDADPPALLDRYIAQISRVIDCIDSLEK